MSFTFCPFLLPVPLAEVKGVLSQWLSGPNCQLLGYTMTAGCPLLFQCHLGSVASNLLAVLSYLSLYCFSATVLVCLSILSISFPYTHTSITSCSGLGPTSTPSLL